MGKVQSAAMGEEKCSSSPKEKNGRKGKAIVFSAERFNKIKKNSTKEDEVARLKKIEEEQKRKEQFKKDSEESKKKFVGNIKITAQQILANQKRALEKSDKEAKEMFEKTKENEDANRRERIAKAEELLENQKPGPRDLCTAAVQSEIMRARNKQQNLKKEFQQAKLEQECLDKLKCQSQANPFVEEEKERLVERQQNTNTYKKELLQTISCNAKQRADKHKEQIKEEQVVLQKLDSEVKAQIAKERAGMEKKRATLRQNAVQAMRMTEQRRLREQMGEEVEDRMRCVYQVGKRHLDDLRDDQAKKIVNERAALMEANMQHLVAVQPNVEAIESARLRRDISHHQLKFTQEEREKVLRDRAAKKARIESFLRDMERIKQNKQNGEEERRYYMAQRFKNSDMNAAFTENVKNERQRKMQELRNQLNAQTDDAKRLAQQEKAEALRDYDPTKHELEDKYYFTYAHQLMEDAYRKDRPLYPFVKAVQQYKRKNYIDCGDRMPPKHLVSQVGIGCRQPGDSVAARKHPDAMRSVREEIREKCSQINELLAKAALEEAEALKKPCSPECPVDCSHKRGFGEKRPGVDECNFLRYSMIELKRLNQYTNPSID